MSATFRQMKSSAHCLFQWLSRDHFKKCELLRAEQVPEIHQEPFILTGYRPLHKPWKYYLNSILHLHNETFNVWTHLVGFFVVLAHLVHFLKDYDVINDKIAWPILTFGICSLLSMGLSAGAHLLHSKSAWHHYVLFMLDHAAVAVYGYGVGMCSMYICSDKRFRDAFHAWYLPANVLISSFVFLMFCKARGVRSCSADDERRRKLMATSALLQGIFVLSPLIPRYIDCITDSSCDLTDTMGHVTYVLFLDIMCAISFIGYIPERWMPGRCDIVGHSHQIFHIIAVVTIVAKFRAIKIDIAGLNIAHEVFPSFGAICFSFCALMVLDAITYINFLQTAKTPPSIRNHIESRAKFKWRP